MVAAAVVGGAVIGAAGSAYSANKGAKASQQGAAQSDATQRYMYDTTRADYQPWRDVGKSALNQMAELYGLPQSGVDQTAAKAPNYAAFFESPDYKFAYDEGMRATEGSLARRGLGNSGSALKALTRYGQGMASQQLGNYRNSLAALAGIGQTATGQTATAGMNAANNISASQQNAADARASAYLNQGSAIQGATNQIGQFAMLNAMGAFK